MRAGCRATRCPTRARPPPRRTPARSACRGCSGCGRARSARMRNVHRQRRVAVGIADVRDAELLRQRLQLAVAVGDADRAVVVALRRAATRAPCGGSACSFSEFVVTDMPSCTGVVQAGSRRPTPDTSTMHSRQAPDRASGPPGSTAWECTCRWRARPPGWSGPPLALDVFAVDADGYFLRQGESLLTAGRARSRMSQRRQRPASSSASTGVRPMRRLRRKS